MKSYYKLSSNEVLRVLAVNSDQGLSGAEVDRRLEEYGPNALAVKKGISPWQIFIGQFKDALIIILLVAAGISLILSRFEESGSITEGLLILAIVFAIAIVGFLNEYKAEKTVEALSKLVGQRARVRRGGDEIEIDAKDLVPGDIVVLEEGQKVPADIRLISVVSLRANEASLTGESLPVNKELEIIANDAPLGDQRNMIFSGTIIAAGKGVGVVVATGQQTEIGKIATLVDDAVDEDTPMQKKLDRLGGQLGKVIIAVCVIVFVVIFFLSKELQDVNFIQRLLLAFTAAVALAVAAIPEGLAFVVRISLALGARRMAAKNALVRRLSAVEALGSTDVICSDKTGTLTRGEMTVRELWSSGTIYHVTGSGYEDKGSFLKDNNPVTKLSTLQVLLTTGLLCNNSRIQKGAVVGDPTEAALLVSAHKAGLHESKDLPRVHEIPFTSDRKMMTTIHHQGKDYVVSTKGATEIMLESCTSILMNGKVVKLTPAMKKAILLENERMAQGALRVLAFGTKLLKQLPKGDKTIESGLTFVGLQAMMDPPRTEIKDVIARVTKEAGMRVVMITGDYVETAKAVAAEIGITGNALTGPEIDKLSQIDFEKKVMEIGIYARVNPEHKIRIVQALKAHGLQVAMTGDGVNDAPAIKAADIGIAMGKSGTDVAKEAADLILLDDQFLTIIAAIEEGRGIFDNVRKFVSYLLSANIAEVITVLFGVLFFNDLVITAVQLLFINVVTDGLPAVALGSDPAEKNIMRYHPKRFQKNIVDRKLWIGMTAFGVLMSIILLTHFAYAQAAHGLTYAVSVVFTSMVILEMVRLIDIRSSYKVSWLSNPWLIVAIVSSLLLQVFVIMFAPLASIFGAVPISANDWAIIVASGIALFIGMRITNKVLDIAIPDAGQVKSPKLAQA